MHLSTTSLVSRATSALSTVDVETVAQAEMSVSVRRSMNLVSLEGGSVDGARTVWSVGAGDSVEVSTVAVSVHEEFAISETRVTSPTSLMSRLNSDVATSSLRDVTSSVTLARRVPQSTSGELSLTSVAQLYKDFYTQTYIRFEVIYKNPSNFLYAKKFLEFHSATLSTLCPNKKRDNVVDDKLK